MIVLVMGQAAAHQFEAQIDEVGIDGVRLAVVTDVLAAPGEVRLPDALAGHAELAGKAENWAMLSSPTRPRPWKPASTSIRST